MSSTLEETLRGMFSERGLDFWSEGTITYEEGKAYEEAAVEDFKSLILSEAHRIGMEAIGGDDIHGANAHGISCISINTEKRAQRERLTKITGVNE